MKGEKVKAESEGARWNRWLSVVHPPHTKWKVNGERWTVKKVKDESERWKVKRVNVNDYQLFTRHREKIVKGWKVKRWKLRVNGERWKVKRWKLRVKGETSECWRASVSWISVVHPPGTKMSERVNGERWQVKRWTLRVKGERWDVKGKIACVLNIGRSPATDKK